MSTFKTHSRMLGDATEFGRSLLTSADAAAARTTLEVGAGGGGGGDDTRFPVIPHDFTTGVGVGNSTKDTDALQAWAAYISDNNVGSALLGYKLGEAANFQLASPLFIGPAGGTIATRVVHCAATIRATAPMVDIVSLRSMWGSMLPGWLHIRGTGGSSVASNTCWNGVNIFSSGRVSLGYITVSELRGWGVRNTGGNVHFANIDKVNATDCGVGRGTRGLVLDVTAFDKTGSGNSSGQRSVLTCSNLAEVLPPESLPLFGFVDVNGYPHKIYAVDYELGTVSVFPYIRTAEEVTGEYPLVLGGGLRLGGQTAQTRVGGVSTTRCGTGMWLYGVGTPQVQSFGSQFDGNCIVLGQSNSTVFGGATIMGAYFEATMLGAIIQVNQTSSSVNGTFISGITSLSKSQIFSPGNRQANGEPIDSRYFPVTLILNNQMWFPWSEQDVRSDATQSALTGIVLSNGAPRPYTPMRRTTSSNFTVSLVDDKDYRRNKGSVPVDVLLAGRGARKGASGGYVGNITVSAEEGYTINDTGFRSVSLTGPAKPSLIKAWLEDDGSGPTIWRVTLDELNILGGSEATPTFPGNITDLDVVDSSSSTLTVEFTEATNADSYEYRHSLNNSPGAWGTPAPLGGSAADGTFTGTVEGLDANEAYDIQVRGANTNGFGNWSNTATGATTLAPTTISNLAVSATAADSVTLQFSPSINADSYEARHSVTTLNEWVEHDISVSGTSILVGTVEDLEEDETYDFQVRGVNAFGEGEWSNLVTATAQLAAPGDITDLSISSVGHESLGLSFTAAIQATSYQARYSITTLDDWAETSLSVSGSGTLTGTLSGLTNDTTYDVQVRGVNDTGAGEWSNLVTGTPESQLHYQIDTFAESGTWTAPAGVTLVDYAEGWGSGGGSSYDSDTTTRMGGGGSAYARAHDITVTPETGYTVTVAAASSSDTDGDDSSFIDGSTLLIKGGKSASNGREGGLASESVGDVKFDGGTGPTSSTSSQPGGAAAGDMEAATGANPGNRQPGRAAAASGSRTVPGGGGSSVSDATGGARGEIRIHYKRPALAGFPSVISRNWGRVGALDTIPTNHPIAMPPSIVPGNLLLAWFSIRSAPTLTIPSDWTTLVDVDSAGGVKGALLYKFAEGSDELAITSSLARYSAHLTWQIATTGAPTVQADIGTGSTPDAPSHSPAAGSGKYLWIAMAAQFNTRRNQALAPASYESYNYLNSQNHTNGVSAEAAERFLEAATENPGVFTGSHSNPWVAATVAVPLE